MISQSLEREGNEFRCIDDIFSPQPPSAFAGWLPVSCCNGGCSTREAAVESSECRMTATGRTETSIVRGPTASLAQCNTLSSYQPSNPDKRTARYS